MVGVAEVAAVLAKVRVAWSVRAVTVTALPWRVSLRGSTRRPRSMAHRVAVVD
jgi:hypothetical protein